MESAAPARHSTSYHTPVHHVLSVPELLNLIFSYLDRKDHARNILVCKKWSEVALDILWHDVEDLRRGFRVLAPLVATQEVPLWAQDIMRMPLRFARGLKPSDWKRFMRYAPRVRTLSVRSPVIDMKLDASYIFDEISKTCPTAHIFPRLSSLTWDCTRASDLRFSLMCMRQDIKEFAVKLPSLPPFFFKEIALRMPKLTVLDLRFKFSVKTIEDDLCWLVDALPRLQKIIVPKYTLTSKVMKALSRKEHLGVLQFEYLTHQGAGSVEDILDWAPTLEDHAFPALYSLNLNIQLHQMIGFMHVPFFPGHIRLIHLHLTHPGTPAQLQAFLTTAAGALPCLTDLILKFVGEPTPFVFHANPSSTDEERVTWDTLRPVLRFQCLVAFEVRWHSALALTEDDLAELAQSWPTLERLTLMCELPTACPPPLTLRVLLPFARHCPRLRQLGLHLSADTPNLDSVLTPFNFPHLQRLEFGLSHIAAAHQLQAGCFLQRLVPASIGFDMGTPWDTSVRKLRIVPATDADRRALDKLLATRMMWCMEWCKTLVLARPHKPRGTL